MPRTVAASSTACAAFDHSGESTLDTSVWELRQALAISPGFAELQTHHAIMATTTVLLSPSLASSIPSLRLCPVPQTISGPTAEQLAEALDALRRMKAVTNPAISATAAPLFLPSGTSTAGGGGAATAAAGGGGGKRSGPAAASAGALDLHCA